MGKKQYGAWALAALLGAFSLSGCVQMPTETHGVVSLKPQISFQMANDGLASAQVFVDELPVGVAGQFIAKQAALQIEPGTHQLRVQLGGQVLINERFYVGDGVSKVFELR